MPICKFCEQEIEWEWDEEKEKWKAIHFTPKRNKPTLKCSGLAQIKRDTWLEANKSRYAAARRLGGNLDDSFESARARG